MSWVRAAILFLTVVLAYGNTLQSSFVFDDVTTIIYNPNIRSLSPIAKIFERTNDLDVTSWGRPLVALSLAWNYSLGELKVVGYHLFNILVHFLNGLLVWVLARELLRVQRASPACAAEADSLSFVIALLWLAHPLGTSVTTYTVQRAESMMAFFYLLTLWGGARFWRSPAQWPWALLAIFSCSLGMLAKQTMVTAPISLLLLGWIFHRKTFFSTLRTQWGFPLGLASSWLILGWAMSVWPRHATVGFGVRGVGSWEYLLIQCRVIPYYFGLIFWPPQLSLNYPQRVWSSVAEVPPGTWPLFSSPWEVLPEAMGLFALLALTIWLLWKSPAGGFLLALVFLILSPTSSVVPIATSVAADHRMYLPSAAVIALIVIGFYLFTLKAPKTEKKSISSLRVTTVVLLVLALLANTHLRNEDYRDGYTVWEKSLAQHPHDALGWNELGSTYWRLGDLPHAAKAFERGSALCSDYTLPLANLAVCQWNLGERLQGINNLVSVTTKEPDNLNAWRNLANFFDQLHDSTRAQSCYQQILKIRPHDEEATKALAASFQ